MTTRALYRAPFLAELGSIAQMTRVNVAGALGGATTEVNAAICLSAQSAGLTAVVNADGGCVIAAGGS